MDIDAWSAAMNVLSLHSNLVVNTPELTLQSAVRQIVNKASDLSRQSSCANGDVVFVALHAGKLFLCSARSGP